MCYLVQWSGEQHRRVAGAADWCSESFSYRIIISYCAGAGVRCFRVSENIVGIRYTDNTAIQVNILHSFNIFNSPHVEKLFFLKIEFKCSEVVIILLGLFCKFDYS